MENTQDILLVKSLIEGCKSYFAVAILKSRSEMSEPGASSALILYISARHPFHIAETKTKLSWGMRSKRPSNRLESQLFKPQGYFPYNKFPHCAQ